MHGHFPQRAVAQDASLLEGFVARKRPPRRKEHREVARRGLGGARAARQGPYRSGDERDGLGTRLYDEDHGARLNGRGVSL